MKNLEMINFYNCQVLLLGNRPIFWVTMPGNQPISMYHYQEIATKKALFREYSTSAKTKIF